MCTLSANVFDFFTTSKRVHLFLSSASSSCAAAVALHPLHPDSFSIEKVQITLFNQQVGVASMPRYDHGGMPPKPKEKGVNKVKLEVRHQH